MDLSDSETLVLSDGPVLIAWRRNSRAHRVSLSIDPRGGAVVVTLPLRAARGAGVALLMNNVAWVTDRLARLPDAIPFADGALVPIDGRPHAIRHLPGACRGAWVEGDELRVSGAPEFLRRRVADFLRKEARQRLTALALSKAASIGHPPRRVSMKDTRTRWGSCTSDGVLSFSWRLVMAPEFVQDYVTAHEVAHLRHMNHGKRFWALVRKLTPHTATAVPWLRTEGSRLLRTG
ncbi:MAG: M48 family metallopeptidase [Pseudomonadota bacterium]|nr:M48 family metallopeptidase [Pseudomonadota bacterium]